MSADNEKINVNYLGNMKKINLKPNDVLVVQTEKILSFEQTIRVKEQLEKFFGGNKVLVMAEGLKLGVVSLNNLKDISNDQPN